MKLNKNHFDKIFTFTIRNTDENDAYKNIAGNLTKLNTPTDALPLALFNNHIVQANIPDDLSSYFLQIKRQNCN
jgi:hypothetical protein